LKDVVAPTAIMIPEDHIQTNRGMAYNRPSSMKLALASAKLNYFLLAWLFLLFWWGSPTFHNLLIRRLGSNSSHVKSNW
jgi:hypothetical protein